MSVYVHSTRIPTAYSVVLYDQVLKRCDHNMCAITDHCKQLHVAYIVIAVQSWSDSRMNYWWIKLLGHEFNRGWYRHRYYTYVGIGDKLLLCVVEVVLVCVHACGASLLEARFT